MQRQFQARMLCSDFSQSILIVILWRPISQMIPNALLSWNHSLLVVLQKMFDQLAPASLRGQFSGPRTSVSTNSQFPVKLLSTNKTASFFYKENSCIQPSNTFLVYDIFLDQLLNHSLHSLFSGILFCFLSLLPVAQFQRQILLPLSWVCGFQFYLNSIHNLSLYNRNLRI